MTSAVAEMVLYAITAVSVLVWVEGLRFLVATIRTGRKGAEEFSKLDEPAPANIIYGTAEVAGNAGELSQKAAGLLAAKSVKIFERTDEMIDFETPSEAMPGQNVMMPSVHGQMRFTPVSAQSTRVDYAIAKPHMKIMLILGFGCLGMGFAAIVGGFMAIYFLVVPSQFEAMRWQTLQMMQVAHFLWPPFLFGGLYRKSVSIIKVQFDTFIQNLPFLKA
jgi:hypothetical protein